MLEELFLNFEGRDRFIRNHFYRRGEPENPFSPDFYDEDALYEYCVVKNFIELLNKSWELTDDRSFTLDYCVLPSAGGANRISNWLIRSQDDKQPVEKRWTVNEQLMYIRCHIQSEKHTGAVDNRLMEKYMVKFIQVYSHGSSCL